ncbi:Na/Pi cotransporter family protein [Paenibacillus albiflavus]|uniref:Na/Pi cotransporter family protein n=1 Tax=Paenibacillus albiflavus TaxID=2545760 RepID=A0A4R4EFY2_9BACL|nr:Na/Pi symporter [Paenibacillus albiflavus]TCZ77018.1 Na/Pi cotransporter family protein [Paenibacillus albiflavus]
MFNAIIVPILFGLALFLLGMKMMELAMHAWAGPSLNKWLERLTKTPLRGMVAGTALTALMQSSSAITVITIGFVNAGVLRFSQTLGIILGSNIGTCLTTELIGASLGRIGMPLLLGAASIWLATLLVSEPNAAQRAGGWLHHARCGSASAAGFALVLLGIQTMQRIGPALEARGLFAWFAERSGSGLLWAVIAGVVVTALIHSSAAVIALAMGLAASGSLSPELGVAVTLGANIGTCVTAWLASIGGTRAATFVAWAHIALNFGGVLLFLPFITELTQISAWFSELPAMQIARSQTIFNVACSLLALPICYLPFIRRIKHPPLQAK